MTSPSEQTLKTMRRLEAYITAQLDGCPMNPHALAERLGAIWADLQMFDVVIERGEHNRIDVFLPLAWLDGLPSDATINAYLDSKGEPS